MLFSEIYSTIPPTDSSALDVDTRIPYSPCRTRRAGARTCRDTGAVRREPERGDADPALRAECCLEPGCGASTMTSSWRRAWSTRYIEYEVPDAILGAGCRVIITDWAIFSSPVIDRRAFQRHRTMPGGLKRAVRW